VQSIQITFRYLKKKEISNHTNLHVALFSDEMDFV